MKYFIDFEFIESFYKPPFGKRRHFIDMISIGIASEDNRGLYFISSEYDYRDADEWVQKNVIQKAYTNAIHGDNRNRLNAKNFNKVVGIPVDEISVNVLEWIGNDKKIEFYGYYSDYDWVLFCSMFGRMIDLPKGFPMYCIDLKQMMDDRHVDSKHPDCPKQKNEHIALHDAVWNKDVYNWLINIDKKIP